MTSPIFNSYSARNWEANSRLSQPPNLLEVMLSMHEMKPFPILGGEWTEERVIHDRPMSQLHFAAGKQFIHFGDLRQNLRQQDATLRHAQAASHSSSSVCRVGAGSVVLRSVPANSTIVGVPGHIVLRDGKRVVITDPKDIRDPLSDVIIRLAAEIHELREKFLQHSHDALGAEPNLTIDEGTATPNISPQELFQDDYQI